MIVIGSYAARHGGWLPTWRDQCGFVGSRDIDIVGPIGTHEKLNGSMVDRKHNQFFIYDGYHAIDLWENDEVFQIMEMLCPEQHSIQRLGNVRLATPEIVWATLFLTAGCVKHWHDKSFHDLKFYDKIVKSRGLITDDHVRIAYLYREKMLAIIFDNCK